MELEAALQRERADLERRARALREEVASQERRLQVPRDRVARVHSRCWGPMSGCLASGE